MEVLTSLTQLDERVFLYLNNLGSSRWDWFWFFVTDKWSSIPLYLFLLFLLYKKTGHKSVLFTLGLIVLLIVCSDQFSNVLKSSVQRLRPCRLNLDSRSIANCGLYGFPSAHAFSSMALAVLMGLILKPFYKYALFALVLWSLALGFSRIYVGVHYPGDVLVGFVLGMLLGYGFFCLRSVLLYKLKIMVRSGLALFPEKDCKDLCEHSLYQCQKYLLWGMLIVVTILYARTELKSGIFVLEGTPYEFYYEMLALLISMIGFSLRLFTLGFSTQKNKLQEYDKIYSNHLLQVRGAYSVMRHPLYVANFLICMGPVLWTGSYWFIVFFFVAYWIYYTEIIEIKERILREKYGTKFDYWAAKTPAFIPKLSNFKKPVPKFSWKVFLLKELRFLFYLLLVYCTFDVLGELIGGTQYEFNYFLIGASVLTGVGLIIVAYFKKKIDLQYV